MNQVYSRIALCLLASMAFVSESKAATPAVVDMVVGETKVLDRKTHLHTISCVAPLGNELAESQLVNRNRINGISTLFSGASLNLQDQMVQCGTKQLADTAFSANLICVVDHKISWISAAAYTQQKVELANSEIVDGKLTTDALSRMSDLCKTVGRIVSNIQIRNVTN